MPVIAPALKAMSRPPARLLEAACAVRTLARTDTFMPMKPATPESTAPIRKPIAAAQPMSNQAMTKTMAPTIAMVRYWRLRYADAPSRIAAAISCIFADPVSAAMTERVAQTE